MELPLDAIRTIMSYLDFATFKIMKISCKKWFNDSYTFESLKCNVLNKNIMFTNKWAKLKVLKLEISHQIWNEFDFGQLRSLQILKLVSSDSRPKNIHLVSLNKLTNLTNLTFKGLYCQSSALPSSIKVLKCITEICFDNLLLIIKTYIDQCPILESLEMGLMKSAEIVYISRMLKKAHPHPICLTFKKLYQRNKFENGFFSTVTETCKLKMPINS
jgi:hypothetical protein